KLLPEGYEFQIEAKHRWLHGWKPIGKRVEKGITAANYEANKNTESSSRISCVFFPVSFSTKKCPNFRSESDYYINGVIKAASTQRGVEFWTWSFPKKARTCFKHKEADGDNRWWPGLLMAMNAGKYFRLRK